MRPCIYGVFLITFFINACSTAAYKTDHKHRVIFLSGSTNNKLEILDWGGTGKPLLFLAGLGNSGHVFDSFATRFTDKFHVYALTRRGFGASEPWEKYDLNTLTDDIISMMDNLSIAKVIIAGHSIAGDEMTKFSAIYPGRTDKLIYLDAAIDRVGLDSLFSDPPQPPRPTTADSASLQAISTFYKAVYGIKIPVEEMRETAVFSKEGKYLKDKTVDTIVGAIIKAVEHPAYTAIKSPALAIYATADVVGDLLPFYNKLDSLNKTKADQLFAVFQKSGAEQRIKFKNEVKGGVVKEIKAANHYIFLSHPDETEKMMREFLN